MKVIFDFDDVIFNAKQFKRELFWVLESHGYVDVSQLYEKARSSGEPFSLRAFIKAIDGTLSEDSFASLYETIIQKSKHLVNEEIFRLMKSLGKDNCYIVTNGVEEFQLDKIRRSIGEDSYREVIVVSGDKREAITMLCKRHGDEEVIFVDDKIAFLNALDFEQCKNLKTVLFNEHGFGNLVAEIEASQRGEAQLEEEEAFKKRRPKLDSGHTSPPSPHEVNHPIMGLR